MLDANGCSSSTTPSVTGSAYLDASGISVQL
ncbi:hypothetical protein LepocDRAFT_00004040, partial [Leptothrix ochracea L12]